MPTVEAQIVGVVEKPSGWTTIETDSRPKFLDTKKPDLIEEARQLMREGSVVIIEYTERDGRNINPNTNLPYKDRYYEGARSGAGSNGRREPEPERQQQREPERQERQQERAPVFGYQTHPTNAWRMALTSGSERAVQTLPLMPVEQRDFDTQKRIALAWAQWIFETPYPAGLGFGEASSSGETRASSYYDPPPPDQEFGF